MTRILVLGGLGYYGAQVTSVLRRLPGIDVTTASRSASHHPGHVSLDITQPADLKAFKEFQVIVNCTNTIGASPLKAASFCLAEGLPFFEMGADLTTCQDLLEMHSAEARGWVFVGVGIFPGFATAMAKWAASQLEQVDSVEFAVRLSPFSGAGRGNCQLMTRALETRSYYVAKGMKLQGAVVGPAGKFAFLGAGTRTAHRVGFPDASLIAASVKAPNVAAYLALNPAFFALNFKLLAKMTAAMGPLRPMMRHFTRLSLLLMRGMLFRKVDTQLQLTVRAADNQGKQIQQQAAFSHGKQATALGVGAACQLWLQAENTPPPGIYTGAYFDFPALVKAVRQLDNDTSQIQIHPQIP